MRQIPIVWTGDETELTIEQSLSQREDRVELLGVLVGLPGSTMTFTTAVHHAAPVTRSETRIHAILFGDAQVDYDGLVSMPAGVAGSNGTLHVRALTFGEQARIRAVPRLEIEENQVTASHGVAISRLNQSQLFYLRSRGLSELEATRLILTGFCEILLSRIGDTRATKQVHRAIEAGLQSMMHGA